MQLPKQPQLSRSTVFLQSRMLPVVRKLSTWGTTVRRTFRQRRRRRDVTVKRTTLPIEIWERIIDFLWYHMHSIRACSLVCRAWQTRSAFLLGAIWAFNEASGVVEYEKLVRRTKGGLDSVSLVLFGSYRPLHEPSNLGSLQAFATMFAGKLQGLHTMRIISARWQSHLMQPDISLCLSSFSAVTELCLERVVFSSAQIFGNLLFSLRNIAVLKCHTVELMSEVGDDSTPFSGGHLMLKRLDLDGEGMNAIIDFFEYMGLLTAVETLSLGKATPLRSKDVTQESLHRLLLAVAPSLRHLYWSCALSVAREYLKLDRPATETKDSSTLTRAVYDHLETIEIDADVSSSDKYMWLSTFLSGITSSTLHTVTISCQSFYSQDVRQRPLRKTSSDFRRVTRAFPLATCLSIDELLSTDHFISIKRLNICIRVTCDGPDIPSIQRCRKLFAPRFPACFARGILQYVVSYYHADVALAKS